MHPLVSLCGSTSPTSEGVRLRAGNIDALYDSGFLRYIKVGDTEILRMINHYVRDEHWNNIPMTITLEKVEHSESGFNIEYTALCLHADVEFQWHCIIEGNEDSSISFRIEGEALHAFKKNRMGFTVLHPIANCAGNECVIVHPGGDEETQIFPKHVSPRQPFLDIKGMRWRPAEDINAVLLFDGDTFETEDQRNWTDASFKTYCTPLSNPFPVTVERGTNIIQSLHLRVTTDGNLPKSGKKRLTFSLSNEPHFPFPKICLPLTNLPHSPAHVRWIRDLQVDYLRLELHSNDFMATEKVSDAMLTGLPLSVVLFFEEGYNLEFIEQLISGADHIAKISVLPKYTHCTDHSLIQRVVPLLRQHFPNARIGGGTDALFTELNRERTPADGLDFLTYSINPQAHATDIRTLIENMVAQADTVNTCREFAAGKEIHVGPVTFRKRKNTMSHLSEGKPATVPPDADPRQISLFGAAWLLGSFKYLSESRAEVITYFETCGWRGLFPHEEQPWPAEFAFPGGAVYPIYLILKELLKYKQCSIVKLVSNDPLTFDGVAFVDKFGKETIILANYSAHDQRVWLPSTFKGATCWSITGTNLGDMILHPEHPPKRKVRIAGDISMLPFSISVLE